MKLEKSCRREINDMARGVGHDDDGDDDYDYYYYYNDGGGV